MDNETQQLAGLYRASNPAPCGCPSSDRLARLADGSAWPWQRRRITSHLAECSRCAEDYQALLTARDGLREALDLPAHGGRVGWLGAPAAAGMAAVAVVAIVSTVALQHGPEPSSMPAGAATDSSADRIFASNFGGDMAADNGNAADDDTLFSSDFDARRGS
jgi:anti-sigma factor RsiW